MLSKYWRMGGSESAPPGNSLTAMHALEDQLKMLPDRGSHESKYEGERCKKP